MLTKPKNVQENSNSEKKKSVTQLLPTTVPQKPLTDALNNKPEPPLISNKPNQPLLKTETTLLRSLILEEEKTTLPMLLLNHTKLPPKQLMKP
jgi:hypothetical protein